MENTKDLLCLAVGAAVEAGRHIMAVYDAPESQWEVERKADDSPLTRADREAHAAIAARLADYKAGLGAKIERI